MPTLRYVIVDVFTDRARRQSARGLHRRARIDTETMQALALEVGFSETTYVLAAEAGGDARLRIFTPTVELPLAGHPVLGAAFVLAGPLQKGLIRLETGRAVVPVELDRDESGAIVFGRMIQPVPTVEPHPDPLLRALGVDNSRLRWSVTPSSPPAASFASKASYASAKKAATLAVAARAASTGWAPAARSVR